MEENQKELKLAEKIVHHSYFGRTYSATFTDNSTAERFESYVKCGGLESRISNLQTLRDEVQRVI